MDNGCMLFRNAALLLASFVAASWAAEKHPGLATLEKRCAGCHMGAQKKSGLDLSSRALMIRGGDRGPALVPGDAAGSLLYRVAARTAEPHMPFNAPALVSAETESIAAWINAGAPAPGMPASTTPPAAVKSNHWSFQMPSRPAVPASSLSAGGGNPIDAFLEAERRKQNVIALPEADGRTLVRRLYLDLTGVPPTRAETQQFLDDRAPGAYERLADKLLDDPRYGERWGRHWMDIWRYSDWYGWRRGNDVRNSAKFLWRWRDWIVESLNRDKGYDRMIVEMLAGDEVAPGNPDVLRATGYLARSFSKYDRHGWLQDAVDHSAMAFLGVTVKCARCHDHKYDPFRQEEYYQLRAFFEPYQVRTDRVAGQVDTDKNGISRVYDAEPEAKTELLIRGDIQNPDKETPIVPATPAVLGGVLSKPEPVSLSVENFYPDIRPFVHEDLIAQARADIEKARAAVTEAKDDTARMLAQKSLAATEAALPALEARIAADRAKYARPLDSARAEELATAARKAERAAGVLRADENVARAQVEMTAALAAKPTDEKRINEAQKKLTAAVEALTQAPEGQHTSLGKAYPEKSSGRRTALANWIANKANPLTARVAVNHIWLRHFGKGIVATPAEFGLNGKAPTHPALLDWLAVEFMESGWSMKRMHRLMVTSRAYRMRSSAGTEQLDSARTDPENRYLWRMNPRRMEAESVRDSILQVSGTLDSTLGGPEIDGNKAFQSRRRSIYLEHTPDVPIQFLKTFDSANMTECYAREESVVPHQALALANSELSREHAALLAKRLGDDGQRSEQFIAAAFETVLGRAATLAERSRAESFLAGKPVAQGREDLVHVLLNHNDFVTIR